MAEKKHLLLQSVSRDFICIVANLKNSRFMVVINENCCISDLIKEIEVTFAKLSSIKVSIKTLKNSANAVLPEWYSITPLLKNHDEVYAFTEDRTELSSVDVTRCSHCCNNTMNNVSSSFGMRVLPDSGFTSPVEKLRTSREGDGPDEHIEVNRDKVEHMVNRGDGNLSQDEGNDVLSEIFSMKDDNGNLSKPKPDNQVLRNSNVDVDDALGGKEADKSQNLKEISKDESGSESADESASLVSHESSDKKAKDVKKDASQNLASQNNNSFESNESVHKANENGKASQQTKSVDISQRQAKTKNASKAVQENSIPGAARHESDTDESSTGSETIDPDDKHEGKKKKIALPVKKHAEVSGKQMKPLSGENINVTAAKKGSRDSRAKAGNSESESSDSSLESEVMEVDNVGNTENNIVMVTSGSAAESKDVRKNNFVNNKNISSADKQDEHKDTDKKAKDLTTNKTVKDKVKNGVEDETKKLDVKSKSEKTRNESVDDEDGGTSNSSSSSSDTDSDDGKTFKKPKNDTKKDDISKNGIKIIDARMTKEKESVKETRGSKKGERNVVKANSDNESDSFSISESSWSSSDDDVKNVKTVKNESIDKGETKVVNGKSSQKEKQTKLPAKNSSKGRVEDKSSDKHKQTDLDPPGESAGEDKRKKQSSPASIARSKKNASSSKLKVTSKKVEKAKGKRTDGEDKSDDETSVSTLKQPLTQLPKQSKVKGKGDAGQSDSGESRSDDEDTVTKDREIAKDGKKKGKGDAAGHGATTPQPNKPSTSTSRKSAVMLSASKVASWLLSNPVSENAANEEQINGTESSLKTKTVPKSKAKGGTIEVEETTVSKSPLKPKADSDNKIKESISNVEALVDKIYGDDTIVTAKQTTQPQKRKLDEESEQEQSTKSKKSKKKKQARIKNETQIIEETIEQQDKPAFKYPVTPKKGKNIPLTLPKKSRGLEALIDDDSDYSMASAKISKKQKIAPLTFNQRVKPTRFLSKSNNNNRKTVDSKTPKTSQVKKISSSQSRKTLEMNSNEEEYLNNVDLNTDSILNDKSIKW